MPTKEELKSLQAAPLWEKVIFTENRIKDWVDWYGTNGVYVSFSGGKDSTVLLHIVRQMYPDIEAVFVNTGLEYPEIQSFVKSFDNVTILRPKMRFDEVIRKYGYPFIGKTVSHNVSILRNCPNGKVAKNVFNPNKKGKYAMHKWKPMASLSFLVSEKCCDVMKKEPAYEFQEKTGKLPILATLAEESEARKDSWLHNGCNAWDIKRPHSAPMSFWTEQDVLQYIKQNNLPIASVYGDIVCEGADGLQYDRTLTDCGSRFCTTGCDRTGCVYCAFGANGEEGESRFERLKKTHLRQYEYCMGGGAYQWHGKVHASKRWHTIDFINDDGSSMSDDEIEKYVQLHMNDKDYRFEKVWKPTKEGLGMKHCIDELNKIYGKDFIRY